MEDYKKKYESLMKNIKRLRESVNPEWKQTIECYIPELKSSDDEKIRKEIISVVEQYVKICERESAPCDEEDITNWIAWLKKQGEQNNKHLYDVIIALWDLLDKIDTFSDLQIDDTNLDNPFKKIEYIAQERHKFVKSDGYNLYIQGEQITDFKQSKQKPADKCIGCNNFKGCITCTDGDQYAHLTEQKPTDKVESKFKVGDWIYHERSGNTFRINKIENDLYVSDEGATISLGRQNNWRLWTIQDAEDGDVLCDYYEGYNNPLIFILKKFEHVNFGLVKPSDYSSYCFLTAGDRQKFEEGSYHHKCNIKPATKEQRDQLEKAMKEAGYEWDAKKKELKKIEQTYFQKQEWTGYDEKAYEIALLDIDKSPSITKNNTIDWLKSLKERMKGE